MVSVTNLIDILNKPALLSWANKIGLQGVSLKDYRKKSTEKGTSLHEKVEMYFKNGTLFEGSKKLEKCIEGFKVLYVEKELSNNFLKGRADLILEKEGKTYVVDFKSSSNIYLSTKLQLSAYKHLGNYDYICVIDLYNFKLINLNIETKKYYEILARLYQVRELLINLNERL